LTLTKGTEVGMVMGTAGCMAPVQVRGQTADHRADIFAFGAILYEMLAGKRAFQKPTSAETMTAILNEDPSAISQVATNLPPALQRVVHRCLEKSPEQRFQSASDLAFALDALSDSSQTATPPVRDHSSARGMRRGLAVSAVVLIILLLAGAGYWLKTRLAHPVANKSLVVRELTASSGDDPVSDGLISPDGHQLIYSSHNEGLTLLQIETGEKRQFPSAGSAIPVSWFPDGYHLLIEPLTGHVLLKMSTLDGSTQRILDDSFWVVSAAVSPDGRRIAWVGGPPDHYQDVWVMGAGGDSPHRVLTAASYRYLDWSPDSNHIAVSYFKGNIDDAQEVSLQSCDPDGQQCSVIVSDKGLLRSSGGPSPVVWCADNRIVYALRSSGDKYETSGLSRWTLCLDAQCRRQLS
jgi:hypothetical protein